MCIIDRKTYLHSDGRRDTFEKVTRCKRAVGSSLCKNVVRREAQGAQYVETRPSHDRTPSDGVIITEGRDGRKRVYRDLSNRSSNSSSIRRSNTFSERSSMTTPSSTSSPLFPEPKTAGPTPSPSPFGDLPPPLERSRQPYPPFPPPGPEVTIGPDGTAQYSRPPSLYMDRAVEIERPSTSAGERTLPRQNSSFDSTKAQVDDSEEPLPPKTKRKSSMKIKTDVRPSRSSSSPSVESPGLSNLPGISHLRKDSGKHVPQPESSKQARDRSDSDRNGRKGKGKAAKDEKPRRRATDDDKLKKDAEAMRRSEEDRRRSEEDRRRKEAEEERQARIERGRLAESDRRQSARHLEAEAARLRESFKNPARDDVPSDSSRERQRQATLSALERDADPEEYDPIHPYLDAEEAQMERERAAAHFRRESANAMPPPPPSYPDDRYRREPPNDMSTSYFNDQARRDAEARAAYQRRAERDRQPTRPRINTYNTSPASTRSPLSFSPRAQPVVHQYPSARHSGTIPQRGADVIAREQARGSRDSGNMTDAFGNLNVGDDEEPQPSEGRYYYYDDQGRKRRYQ